MPDQEINTDLPNSFELLDFELAKALKQCSEIGLLWDDIPAARVIEAEMLEEFKSELPPVTGVTTSDHRVSGSVNSPEVPVRIYRPENYSDALPALLWIHGGGYVMGSIETADYVIKQLVESVGCVVVSVEYRLAPEHPFPAAIDDCYSALQWLFSHADELGVDKSRIAIGGVSAGGGLAACLAIMVRDRSEIPVMFQILMCPMLDERSETHSSYSITDPRVWNRDCNLRGWEAYLGQKIGDRKVSPYAAAARADDLRNLPPAYISVGSLDLFIDENIHYNQRLIQAGVPAEMHIFSGAFHAFEFQVLSAQISLRAWAMHYEILKQAFKSI